MLLTCPALGRFAPTYFSVLGQHLAPDGLAVVWAEPRPASTAVPVHLQLVEAHGQLTELMLGRALLLFCGLRGDRESGHGRQRTGTAAWLGIWAGFPGGLKPRRNQAGRARGGLSLGTLAVLGSGASAGPSDQHLGPRVPVVS